MRRNFVIASVFHIAILGLAVLWENLGGSFGKPAMASVSLFTPADLLGEMPKGEGYGRGNYRPPEPAGGGAQAIAGPSESILTPAESIAPAPKADDVLIPKKVAPKKPAAPTKPATTVKPATTAKPSTTGSAQRSAPATASAKGTGSSAEDIKNRFAKALQTTDDGTPYGDGRKAGGGTGRGRIGSPTGAADGVVGGVGQGSANWRYFQHVHDVMYRAWEQPGSALDRKLVATVQLRVARDGTITDVRLSIGSGNRAMDDSVLAAARRVPRLEPPPLELVRGETANITVDFQVEG